MYFLRLGRLKEEIVRSEVSERDTFKYIIAHTILLGIAAIPDDNTNDFDLFVSLINIPIVVAGIAFCYSGNGGDSGSKFLLKIVSIAWVVGVRIFIVIISIILASFYLMKTFGVNLNPGTNVYTAVFYILINVLYFWRIYVHIKDINAKDT